MRRPGAPREIPPPLELECLKVLWKLGEASVKDVRGALLPSRPLAYTTIMTLLDRLVRKGAAARRRVGRLYLYAPLRTEEQVRRLAVRQLAEALFGGSLDQLRAFLAEPAPPAPPPGSGSESGSLDAVLL